MAHNCKCAICGITFDRDKIQAVYHGSRRYSHYKCNPSGELVYPLVEDISKIQVKSLSNEVKDKIASDKAKEEIYFYLKDVMKEDINYVKFQTQIEKYVKNGLGYPGILKILKYAHEVAHIDVSKANGGIGIIPYLEHDAKNYYYSIYLAQEMNKDKKIEHKIKEIKIKPPERKKRKKYFNFLEEEDE